MAEKTDSCSNCGLPISIGRGNVWHANGVITASYPPHNRGTLYDVEELNNLFPALSEHIGFDITRLVIEGKRRDGKRYVDSLLKKLGEVGKLPGSVDIVLMFHRFIAFWGLALASLVEYQEGESLTLDVEKVYSIPMFEGDVAGMFESLEKKRGEPGWQGDAEHGLLKIVAVEGEPELEERIEAEVEMGVPFVEEGDLEYRSCPECGVPREISEEFEWDVPNARITEKATGKRFILHNTSGIVAVVRSLREELGEEIESIITEISQQYARDYYGLLKDKSSMDAELIKFPSRSWGRPARLHRGEDGYRLRMVNPYCIPIVAGRIWGLIEVFDEGDLALEELTEGDGWVDIILGRL